MTATRIEARRAETVEQGSVHESRISRPKTTYIENGKGARIIVGEHPTEIFLCVDNGRGGTSLFLTPEEAKKLSKAIWYAAGK